MQDNPKVSVVIPVYNVEKFLRRCLDSVINQTFTDWEAICVNDGSPDNSLAILREYAKFEPRIKIVNKKNGGLSDARNAGMAVAKGDYVLFLDSDDFLHKQTLEITYFLAEKNLVDLVCFKYDENLHRHLLNKIHKNLKITDDDIKIKNQVFRLEKLKYKSVDNLLFHCTERNRTVLATVKKPVRRHCFPVLCLYSRKFIQDIPFVQGIIMEDFPWWAEVLSKNPKAVMTDLPLYYYIPNAGSILNSTKALRFINSIAVGLEKVFDLYKNTGKKFAYFNREFIWPFIYIMTGKTKVLDNEMDKEVARRTLTRLYDLGLFDKTVGCRSRRYKRKIKRNLVK